MTDESYWQAVVERDSRADGTFVYGVHSTKIYCRPSCPSRRPLRTGVTLFATPEQAEENGYRACKRCQPNELEPQKALVKQICLYIETHLDSSLTLENLGAELGVSPFHLQKVFKKFMGVTPRQYAEAFRLNQLKASLREGEPVTTALYDAGYGSSSRLYERAPAQLGMTPAAYRKGGTGVTIVYAIVQCPLGYLLVAATEKGICAVRLGDNEAVLEEALEKEYPNALRYRDENRLQHWTGSILNYLEGREVDLSLPLAIAGTPFQQRVWETLRTIPYGATRSYTEIARELGQPGAVRAVARACASNPVALIIPCHRVIRENGELAGYRWGLERKSALLDLEQRSH